MAINISILDWLFNVQRQLFDLILVDLLVLFNKLESKIFWRNYHYKILYRNKNELVALLIVFKNIFDLLNLFVSTKFLIHFNVFTQIIKL